MITAILETILFSASAAVVLTAASILMGLFV